MTGTLPISPPGERAEAASVKRTRTRAVPFWRRREWHLWRTSYLLDTPEKQRGAWVQAHTPDPDEEEDGDPTPALRRRIALVPDIFLGGIQLKSWYRYEAGTLLRVRVWDSAQTDLPPPLLVRVLHVAPGDGSGEWLLSCVFLADN